MSRHVPAISLLAGLLSGLVLACTCCAQSVPDAARSRAAIARTKTGLMARLRGQELTWGAPLFIRIFKHERRLEVWLRQGRQFRLFKVYPVCTSGGRGPGPKTTRGDGRAPEGFYAVGPARMNPYSRFHLAFNLGYPNAYDRAHGRTGGGLMVHGRCVSIGCFAMGDKAMEEIYALADAALRGGQRFFRVHIFPFEMTAANLARQRGSVWFDFWCNLKQGYDLFEAQAVPPVVRVRNRRYVLEPGCDP